MSERAHVSEMERLISRLRRQNRFLLSILCALVILGIGVPLLAQARNPAVSPGSVQRYQLTPGPVDVVFDSQTGTVYAWIPRDEKAGEDPYLIVRDPVNASGSLRPIKWRDERMAKR